MPLGTTEGVVPLLSLDYGMPGVGGPMITAGGLVFIGAAPDGYLRAFDIETGASCGRASCRPAARRHR